MKWLAGTTSAIAAAGVVLICSQTGAAAADQGASPPAVIRSEGCPANPAAPLGRVALIKCFYVATLRASRVAQHQIAFETVDNPDPDTGPSFVDAVALTGDALVDIVHRPGGASALARIDVVAIAIGGPPSARLADGRLTITIVPSIGIAGCPSTDQIEQVALRLGRD
jgi:hypothetical protein